MSVVYGLTCLQCNRDAPYVGDGGFLGAPVLEEEPRTSFEYCGDIPSFGWLYAGLAALGIRPYDLERFREFLVAHAGHRLEMWSDHDEPDTWSAELRAHRDRDDSDSTEEFDALDAERVRRETSGEFVHGRYELTCRTCGASHVSPNAELLRARGPLSISPKQAALFLSRWGSEEYDYSWTHRLIGVADPFDAYFEELIPFVRTHQEHELVASVKPERQRSV